MGLWPWKGPVIKYLFASDRVLASGSGCRTYPLQVEAPRSTSGSSYPVHAANSLLLPLARLFHSGSQNAGMSSAIPTSVGRRSLYSISNPDFSSQDIDQSCAQCGMTSIQLVPLQHQVTSSMFYAFQNSCLHYPDGCPDVRLVSVHPSCAGYGRVRCQGIHNIQCQETRRV